MYHTVNQGTPLYRVTRRDETWPEAVLGLGAYYTAGARRRGRCSLIPFTVAWTAAVGIKSAP
jgi:hypothetical protein